MMDFDTLLLHSSHTGVGFWHKGLYYMSRSECEGRHLKFLKDAIEYYEVLPEKDFGFMHKACVNEIAREAKILDLSVVSFKFENSIIVKFSDKVDIKLSAEEYDNWVDIFANNKITLRSLYDYAK